MAIGKVNVGGSGVKITGQGEVAVNYYENINKGDLVTTRRYFGFDTPIKAPDPDVMPVGSGRVVAFSPDDTYMAIGENNLKIYKKIDDVYIKIAEPIATNPYVNCLHFSNDGLYLVATSTNGSKLYIYKRNGDTFTQLPDPSTMPAQSGNVEFSPDSNHLAVVYSSTSPYGNIYKISEDTFMPITFSMSSTVNYCVDYSPNGKYMAVGTTATGYVHVYLRDGDTYTKLANLSPTPASAVKGVDFSSDGKYLCCVHDTSPYLTIYSIDNVNNIFTKLANPSVLPTGAGAKCSFSSDGQYLGISHAITPFVTIYKIDNTTDTFTKLANPSVLPSSKGQNLAFANLNPLLAVMSYDSSPYMIIYEADILGDYAHIYNGLSDLYRSNYINFGYAKSTGVANDTDKKIVTIPIK